MEFAEGLAGAHGRLLLEQDVPGIHALVHPHDRHAGPRLALNDGPVERRRSTVFREQRRVDIDAAQRREIEHLPRQELSEGGHGNQVRRQIPKGLQKGWVPHALRLEKKQPLRFRKGLHRRGRRLLASPPGPVRLGHHADDRIPVSDENFQRRDGKLRRPHEDDAGLGHLEPLRSCG